MPNQKDREENWLEKCPKDGQLLAVLRGTRELDMLWDHCHTQGAHSRPSGSRAKDMPSPICGSCIMLADMEETVLISQKGMSGPLEVRVYRRVGKKKPGIWFLSHSVLEIIKNYGFPSVKPEK